MKKRSYLIGYTDGVYDLFHVGHLNLIKKAKKYCRKLIVGIHSDSVVYGYKNQYPIINENDRKKIIESIKYVDKCFINSTRDKIKLWEQYKFNVIFIGDDWKGSDRWNKIEKDLSKHNVDVIYLPYTKRISSSIIKKKIIND